MSAVRGHRAALFFALVWCLLAIHGLPRPPGGANSDRIIFGHDEPPKVFPTTKPKATVPDTKIVFRNDDELRTSTIVIDLTNSTTMDNSTVDNSTDVLIKSNLPNCVNHGCPLQGYECDQSSQTCRQILDDI